MRFATYGVSDIGCVRDENQDSLLIVEPARGDARESRGTLVVVADGMGGLVGGRVASRLATETVERTYYDSTGEAGEALELAVAEANHLIHERACTLADGGQMGSTLTAVSLSADGAFVAQVGDSRAYHLRGTEVNQVTRDHSLVQELADRGDVELSAASREMHRNVVTRGLGLLPDVEVDLYTLDDLQEGDTLLLSSDGFHDLVADEEIASVIARHGEELEEAGREFVALARDRGGHDNITVALVHAQPDVAPGSLDSERSGVDNVSAGWLLPLALFVSFALGILLTLALQRSSPGVERIESLKEDVAGSLRLLDEDPLGSQELDELRLRLRELQEKVQGLETRADVDGKSR